MIIDEWRLRGKILSITTDGASNMKGCIELFKLRQDSQERRVSWIHCAAHAIQLCINTALGKKKEEKPDSPMAIFKKCEHIVQFFGSCGAAKKALELEQKVRGKKIYKLVRSNETRWNSRIVMGARVFKLASEIKDAINVVCGSPVKVDEAKAKAARNRLLDFQELSELKDICDLLEPAAALTHSLGGSTYSTVSSVYPKVHGYALAPPLKKNATKPARDLHEKLTKQVETRFVVTKIPEAILVAMFLNPGCFSFSFFDGDSQFLTEAKNLALSALLELAMEIEARTPSVPAATPTKKKSWRDVHNNKSNNTPQSKARLEFSDYFNTITSDIHTYASALDNPQDYWRDMADTYPMMAQLARCYLAVQATSSESERLFSKAGLLLPPKKANLTYQNFFNMLMHSSYEKLIESYQKEEPAKEEAQPSPTNEHTMLPLTDENTQSPTTINSPITINSPTTINSPSAGIPE